MQPPGAQAHDAGSALRRRWRLAARVLCTGTLLACAGGRLASPAQSEMALSVPATGIAPVDRGQFTGAATTLTDAPPPLVGVWAPRRSGASSLSLRLTCPQTADRCLGVARIVTLASVKKSSLRGGTSLGSALFILGRGESKTVSITVATHLRRALRHVHSARLAGVAIAFGANGRSAAAMGPIAVISTTSLR